MASATDYCFATNRAEVKLSELAVGIGPFVVGPAVERKIGRSAMSELAINASEWRSAQWAKDKGLYTEIYEDQGRSLDVIPYKEDSPMAFHWTRGWREGREDYWNGFNQYSFQQKAANF